MQFPKRLLLRGEQFFAQLSNHSVLDCFSLLQGSDDGFCEESHQGLSRRLQNPITGSFLEGESQ